MSKATLGGANVTEMQLAENRIPAMDAKAIADQEARLDEIQGLLFNAHIIAEGIYFERIERKEAHAVAFFLAHKLKNMAHGVAEDAVQFAMSHRATAEQGSFNQIGTVGKGDAK